MENLSILEIASDSHIQKLATYMSIPSKYNYDCDTVLQILNQVNIRKINDLDTLNHIFNKLRIFAYGKDDDIKIERNLTYLDDDLKDHIKKLMLSDKINIDTFYFLFNREFYVDIPILFENGTIYNEEYIYYLNNQIKNGNSKIIDRLILLLAHELKEDNIISNLGYIIDKDNLKYISLYLIIRLCNEHNKFEYSLEKLFEKYIKKLLKNNDAQLIQKLIDSKNEYIKELIVSIYITFNNQSISDYIKSLLAHISIKNETISKILEDSKFLTKEIFLYTDVNQSQEIIKNTFCQKFPAISKNDISYIDTKEIEFSIIDIFKNKEKIINEISGVINELRYCSKEQIEYLKENKLLDSLILCYTYEYTDAINKSERHKREPSFYPYRFDNSFDSFITPPIANIILTFYPEYKETIKEIINGNIKEEDIINVISSKLNTNLDQIESYKLLGYSSFDYFNNAMKPTQTINLELDINI